MKYSKGIFGIIGLALVVIQACSCRGIVYEDRSGCPRYVFIDVTNGDLVGDDSEVGVLCRTVETKAPYVTYYTSVGKMESREFYLTVEDENSVDVFGIVNYQGCEYDGFSNWFVVNDTAFPELYRFSGHCELSAGTNVVPVELCKEFSRVCVSLNGPWSDGSDVCPFELTVMGNSCGIDAKSGVPMYGGYRFQPEETGSGVFRFTVPRQLDDSLLLRLRLKGSVSYKGTYKDEIYMSTYLKVLGNVTWDEKNVPDIDFAVDCRDWTYSVIVYSFNI